jgi:hypothetical protein
MALWQDAVNSGGSDIADAVYHALGWVTGEQDVGPYDELVGRPDDEPSAGLQTS